MYGQCGSDQYAEATFGLTPDATAREQLNAQDDGSVRAYFIRHGSQNWAYSSTADLANTGGCVKTIPRELAMLWKNCPATAD